MSDDALTRLLIGLEETPPVRPAFAGALRLQLHRDLGFASPTVAIPGQPEAPARRGSVVGDWLRRAGEALRPRTPRAVALLIVALILVACAVAAGYVAVHAWLSVGARGPQVMNDFSLTEVFRQADVFYSDLHLAPDGGSIIGLRQPMPGPGEAESDPSQWAVVRIPISGGGGASQAETVMPLEQLRDLVDWGADVDLGSGPVRRSPSAVPGDGLSVASNGDLFLSVSIGALSTGPPGFAPGLPASSALVVVHPDGDAETVVTIRDLAAAGLLGPLTLSNGESISVAASAPDRLWIRAQIPVEVEPAGSSFWLYEVVDPNGDGDWSDRVITPITLPSNVPLVTPDDYAWLYGPFEVEPTVASHDGTHDVLLPMVSRTGEFRLYRLSDVAGGGDFRDPGEVTLLYSGPLGPDAMGLESPSVASRIVVEGGDALTDEVVVGGLTRSTRVTRLVSGTATDVLRALPTPVSSVLAAPDGAIYVATSSAIVEGSWTFHVHRLTPVEPTTSAPPASPSASQTAVPTPSPRAELHPVTPGVERVAYWHSGRNVNEELVVGVDGSGPDTPIPGQSVQGFCRSADGSQLGVLADTEVPNEPFVYIANADGGDMRKISETASGFMCPFSADRMILEENNGERLVLVNPSTGDRKTLMETGGSAYVLSPDMRSLAGVSTITEGSIVRSAGMDVVDVESGARRTIAGPYDLSLDSWGWSPNGRRIYFALAGADVTDFQGSWEIYVVDVDGGAPRRVLETQGYPPTVFWSDDGQTLGVRTKIGACSDPDATGSLLFIDAATGTTREAFHGRTVWAGWSPIDPATYAYATCESLYVVSGGAKQLVAKAPADSLCPDCRDAAAGWPAGWWMGWSPDADYIGLGDESEMAAVVEVATGEIKVLITSVQSGSVGFPCWVP